MNKHNVISYSENNFANGKIQKKALDLQNAIAVNKVIAAITGVFKSDSGNL
ncbi:MAG: hypothetical protein ABIQ40_08815 [Bacteroidia bacterium]